MHNIGGKDKGKTRGRFSCLTLVLIHGLLNATGIPIPKEPKKSVPGWGKLLPTSYFD